MTFPVLIIQASMVTAGDSQEYKLSADNLSAENAEDKLSKLKTGAT
jgi:hypothetical protein